MFCAPASIVSRTDTPVARCRIVTAARNGSRRYFQLASGRESSWLAVSAIDQVKSGMGRLELDAAHLERRAVRRLAALPFARRAIDVFVPRHSEARGSSSEQIELLAFLIRQCHRDPPLFRNRRERPRRRQTTTRAPTREVRPPRRTGALSAATAAATRSSPGLQRYARFRFRWNLKRPRPAPGRTKLITRRARCANPLTRWSACRSALALPTFIRREGTGSVPFGCT